MKVAAALPPPPDRSSPHVAIVGAGAMGAGIATAVALSGRPVRCLARSDDSMAATRSRVTSALQVLNDVGIIDDETRKTSSTLIDYARNVPDTVHGSWLIVESVREDLGLKLDVLGLIGAEASPEAFITTNTSSLRLADLADAVTNPMRFAGLHWFLPAELVEIVEVVSAPKTSALTVHTLGEFVRAMGKAAVHVRRPVPGFVVNRLQYALLREAHGLVAAGVCAPEDIDDALVHGLGPRWSAVGALESMDLAGLDVHVAVAEQLYPELFATTVPDPYLYEITANGDLGAKTGNGIRGEYTAQRLADIAHRRALVARVLRDLPNQT
ncbi:MAG TPA: 3-hydroxyacyl-CoA dehydrogenase NAD-binding domain-containing protein [Terrimesophilobacter sp.]|nr:3-hydroxyacyl-CoA dehydrogenase NAD-binding domain-containing protein [Terrimesophilobacter sp.]